MTDDAFRTLLFLPDQGVVIAYLCAVLATALAVLAWKRLSAQPVDALALASALARDTLQTRRRSPPIVEEVRVAMAPNDGSPEVQAIAEIAAWRFRHPVSTLIAALDPSMASALLILGAAAASPDLVPQETRRLSALMRKAILSGERLTLESAAPSNRVLKEIEIAQVGHAWWETVAIELMATARRRGSWIVPADLEAVLSTELPLLSALSGATLEMVPPEGAGLVSHWLAESMVGTGIPEPWVRDCAPGLAAVAVGRMPI